MSRVQLALNVDDLDEAVTFYSKLVDIGQGPAPSGGLINPRSHTLGPKMNRSAGSKYNGTWGYVVTASSSCSHRGMG